MKSLELCTGAGGLALGVHQAGFAHELLIERDEVASKTLQLNVEAGRLPVASLRGLSKRIEEVDFQGLEDIDLLASGIPCQPFSHAGKRRGLDDSRDVFPAFVNTLSKLQPKAFLLENVSGLTHGHLNEHLSYVRLRLTYPTEHQGKRESWRSHRTRLERLASAGYRDETTYEVLDEVLNAADYGVPQIRKRVFLVGFKTSHALEWSFPKITHSKESLWHQQWVTGEYWDTRNIQPVKALKPADSVIARLRHRGLFDAAPWTTLRDGVADLMPPYRSNHLSCKPSQHYWIPGARPYHGHTGSPLDWPAKSIKAGVHGVPGGENMLRHPNGRVRYFSLREAACLQGFPVAWEFNGERSQITRQIGNAVPVSLARILARSIKSALRKNSITQLHERCRLADT
jgi:DNA (cytosine-5)-methyltransferase 1